MNYSSEGSSSDESDLNEGELKVKKTSTSNKSLQTETLPDTAIQAAAARVDSERIHTVSKLNPI